MIDLASLTADQWLSATGWNLRTLRQYPDKALRVLAEQSARAERLEAALAAERARADQAEQRIADAPHDAENCELVLYPEVSLYPDGDSTCTCWKSAAPTAEQGAAQ